MLRGTILEKKGKKVKKEYVKPSIEFVELRVEERISANCKSPNEAANCNPNAYTSNIN